MTEPVPQGQSLPLAGASARLRGKPGRPRRQAQPGHVQGTVLAPPLVNRGAEHSPSDPQSSAPRLLDVRAAADYLSVSVWTVRDLEAAGELQRVRLPLGARSEVRRLLFDRRDLDRLVDRSRA